MSLTADQITAKNFEEYHKRILPFLNGSFPTPIVNKFSKGDLYSTDEKIVGQWIDGKPVYQKTIEFAQTLPAGNATTVAHGITNLDVPTCFIVNGSLHTTGGNVVPFPTISSLTASLVGVQSITASALNVSVGSNYTGDWTINGGVFTLQYTKTTDSPISIGDGNDYSTDEQVVGSWIDGKPVYQKTISCGALPNTTTKTVAHNITNLKRVIHLDGYGYRSSDGNSQPLPYASISNYFVSVNVVGGNIELYAQGDRSSFEESYITLQYTKTTD